MIRSGRSTSLGVFSFILGLLLVATGNALRGNSWQKRIDRAFLQVDGVSPQGRVRSFQRALKDPELRKDVTKAIDVVREKGFGKGHPEFIELLWPEGTQARRDLEAINALTKQLPERSSQLQETSSSALGLVDIIRSTQGSLRFGEDGSRAAVSSLFEQIQSDPNRVQRLAENFLRNDPIEVESPSYKLLGKYTEGAEMASKEEDEVEVEESTEKKSFLTIPPLELRQYDAFRSVSVPIKATGSSSSKNEMYTLKNMGSALTEIFSYLELGDNSESTLMSMTTPFFISETTADGNGKMFVKLPSGKETNPPEPNESSRVAFDDFSESVTATLAFAGICTDKEIKRQKAKLMERIEKSGDIGWKVKIQESDDAGEEEKKPEYFVLQYNAPGTLPWRRMNEIAVVMEKATIVADQDEVVPETDLEIEQEDAEETTEDSEEMTEEKEAIESDAGADDDKDTSTPEPDVE